MAMSRKGGDDEKLRRRSCSGSARKVKNYLSDDTCARVPLSAWASKNREKNLSSERADVMKSKTGRPWRLVFAGKRCVLVNGERGGRRR